MVRHISLLVVALVVLADQSHGAAVRSKEKQQFKFIGEYRNPSLGANTDAGTQQTSLYFLSQSAAGHQTADSDCKAFLGDDAHLIYIETQEELGNVTDFLSGSDDTASSYWTGGKYDSDKQTFVWGNGAEIGPWAPWDAGHPNSRTPITRISAFTVGSLKLRTEFSTVSKRYICELGAGIPDEEAIPCYNDNDLVIVVDSSGSIGQTNYMIALEFTAKLAIAWTDNPKNRLSVIIYSNNVQSIIGLAENLDVSQIRDKVYNAPYMMGGTASDLGLDGARDEFNSNPRAVPKNLVFMTDGVSNNPQLTIAAANRVQSAGIKSFAVGIGSSLNPDELLAIAGGREDRVFTTDGFADLLKLLQPVSRKVCE